ANLRRNRLDNCHVIPAAVGAEEGTVTFARGLNGHVTPDGADGIQVPVITLDRFAEQRGLSRVDFVKIDVEGFEADVLTGMKGLMSRPGKPVLYIEVHARGEYYNADPRKVCTILEEFYSNIRAYVSPDDFRARRGALGRVLSRVSPFEDLERQCRVDLAEVKQHDDRRYQLLCLP
ncbi:MAG TPA: FkbM family methyltransferase, partial [Myxococcaceae bacterium]